MAEDSCSTCGQALSLVATTCALHAPTNSSCVPNGPAPYSYGSNLPAGKIRLIHLDPGSGKDPICCSLVEQDLSIAEFHALSYTWGDHTCTEAITCDGKLLTIRKNLFDALWQLREDEMLAPLWVDAVCINQTNTVEKTAQVKIMGDIYSRANLVITWLGVETDTDAMGFSWLRKLYKMFRDRLNPSQEESCAMPARLGIPNIDDERWPALFKIFYRPYWFRVWIIQEFVLARELIVQCGRHRVGSEEVLALGAMLEHYKTMRDVAEGNAPWDGVARIIPVPPVYELKILKDRLEKGESLTLLHLLNRMRMFEASVPHDKIFSLVSLSSDVTAGIIDYGRNITDLQVEIAAKCVQESLGFDLLSVAGSEDHLEELPSWVPDWVCGGRRPVPFIGPLFYSQVSLNYEQLWTVVEDKKLRLPGTIVDRIESIEHDMPYMVPTPTLQNVDTLRQATREYGLWIEKCWAMVLRLGTYPTGEDLRTAYWRTLAFNCDLSGYEASDDLEISFDAWKEVQSDFPEACNEIERLVTSLGHDNGPEVPYTGWSFTRMFNGASKSWQVLSSYYRIAKLNDRFNRLAAVGSRFEASMKRYNHMRKFCTTRKGYIGWIPSWAKTGDLICFPENSTIPLVIRRRITRGGFNLVGECYIHNHDCEPIALTGMRVENQILLV